MKRFLTLILVTAASLTNLHGQTLTDSLKAHYPFDKNLKDVTTYGNHLVVNGGISPYVLVSGKDSALTFNGSDRLTSTSVFDATNFTEIAISIWIKTSNITTSSDQLIVQGANMGFAVGVRPGSGKLFATFSGSTVGAYESLNSIADGAWHNIVAQSNGSTTSLYVDGVLDGSVTENLFSPSGGSDNKIFVGASTFNTRSYTGAINDLRIYNRFLSNLEIQDLHLKSLSAPETSKMPLYVSVFPNPSFDGQFSLQIKNFDPGLIITIHDMTGRELMKTSPLPSESLHQMESTLPPGVYTVRAVQNGKVVTSKKVIVL